jgi:cytochrome c-type biogenesis protein
MSLDQLQSATGDARGRRWILANSLAFVLGFSMVFVGMGASFSALGQLLFDYRDRSASWAASSSCLRLYVAGVLRLGFSAATSRSSSARSRPVSSGRGWSA